MDGIVGLATSVGFAVPVEADRATRPTDGAFRQLREEYQAHQALFQAQPINVQQFLQAQAAQIAEALVQRQRQARFDLPDQVLIEARPRRKGEIAYVPLEFRKQTVAGLFDRLPARDIRAAVRQRLTHLEQSPHPAVAVSANLIRFAMVKHMVHDMLPAGYPVTYLLTEGEVVPTTPHTSPDPTVSAAQRFYMPQWVAFDEGRLLVDSIGEAEARVASMQSYLSTLHLAVSLAPYIFADEEYQRKRYGMLGQLINQGRALASDQIGIIIGKIERRAKAGDLNRGFSLSLPYFDDQMLEMRMHDFEVIPAGRTMFIPAFVVLAARREQVTVAQDMRLSHSTRMHLLSELKALERTFDTLESH